MDSSDNQTTTCDDCMVCLCPMNVPTDTITTNCGHIFHTECISTWHDKQTNEFNCPACRESLKLTPKIIYDIPDSNNTLCTYFNGDTLEGVRKNGEFIGHCKYTYLTENDDPLIGFGEFGDTFEGTYENGEFIGHCKYTDINGWKREGIYKNGKFIGERKITYIDGYIVVVDENEKIRHSGYPVFQYDKKSRLIKRFDSIGSCAKSLKCSRYQITNRLKGIKYYGIYGRPPSYLDRYLDQYIFSGMKL